MTAFFSWLRSWLGGLSQSQVTLANKLIALQGVRATRELIVRKLKDKGYMIISDKGLALIKQYEGFRAEPYLCPAGVPTIGYGATYYPDGRKVKLTDKPITESEATMMLKHMLARYEAGVNRYVQVPMAQHEFDALVSFAYNLGLGALQKSSLLKKLNQGDYTSVPREFAKWVYAGGRKLKGLVARRSAEAAMFKGVAV